MAITFPRTFPTSPRPTRIEFTPRKVVGMNTAPGSLVTQTYEWPGERWEAQVTMPPMHGDDAEVWVAWIISLRGPVGSCLLGDMANTTPRGVATGTPQVDGDQSARSRTLNIKTGLSAVTAGWLKAGDWISLGTGSSRRLHKVLVDAALDGSGKATLDIWPALRGAVANNATVYVTNTTGKFMLNSAALAWEPAAALYDLSVMPFIEDLRP